MDGNNGLFPFRIYLARGEIYEKWFTFLEILKPHIIKHNQLITFVSDIGKGLKDAVRDLFPSNPHRFYFRHMYKNFKKKHKGSHMEKMNWGATRAFNVDNHERIMEQINTNKRETFTWLNSKSREHWARSHFDTTCKCDHITNNFSESFNNMILGLRELQFYRVVEKYYLMDMTLLYGRRVMSKE